MLIDCSIFDAGGLYVPSTWVISLLFFISSKAVTTTSRLGNVTRSYVFIVFMYIILFIIYMFLHVVTCIYIINLIIFSDALR